MLETLQERLAGIFKKLTGKGKLSEDDVNDALREVRMALLEADVNLKVIKDFISRVKDKAIGEAVWNSLTPAQLVIKFVRDELLATLNQGEARINFSPQPPTVIMLAGLHGSGKTTTCAKLAAHLRDKGHNPLLVAADLHRPAAITQLETLGQQLHIPVFALRDTQSPLLVCGNGVKHAMRSGNDVVILDTAGRLHVDAELMQELERIKSELQPSEILLVVDAMIGQDSVNVAEKFNAALGIDGVILTKLDGDTRGGAALSVKAVTGKPIKFIGVGEKLNALEPFHPDRLVSRILGMGDVLSLIEKAELSIDRDKAEALEKKLKKQELTLEDFLDQLQQIKKMGPLDQIFSMLPGMSGNKALKGLSVDQKEFNKIEAIIFSMTKGERRNPGILNASRKRRIATGSGTEVCDINRLLNQFESSKKLMKQLMGGAGKVRMPGGLRFPF